MSGSNPRRTKEEWERVFELKRQIEQTTEWHALADVMARERSPYLGTGSEGNRAERRKQDALNRKAKP